jgi:hypothetical protein
MMALFAERIRIYTIEVKGDSGEARVKLLLGFLM